MAEIFVEQRDQGVAAAVPRADVLLVKVEEPRNVYQSHHRGKCAGIVLRQVCLVYQLVGHERRHRSRELVVSMGVLEPK